MADGILHNTDVPAVRIHFTSNFPLETRCTTSEEEPAIVEITSVEYSLEDNGNCFDVTFYVSGIKSFSISDDDQECFIRWELLSYDTGNKIASGTVGTGCIEMGERFNECECSVPSLPSGDYTFKIIYV